MVGMLYRMLDTACSCDGGGLILHCCYTVVTLSLQCCYNVVVLSSVLSGGCWSVLEVGGSVDWCKD
jgi:hypothetical protein